MPNENEQGYDLDTLVDMVQSMDTPQPFTKKPQKKQIKDSSVFDLTFLELFNLKRCSGDVGIEIEMESSNELPYRKSDIPSGWRAENDHSLRGYSREYVLDKPIPFKDIGKNIKNLSLALEKYGSKPIYSYRAGVHVHVNFQNNTVEQLIRFALAFYCFEDVLTKFCGSDREGNHFCLRLKDASYPYEMLRRVRGMGTLMELNSDSLRYATMNFKSLFSYGSVEFRAMRSDPTMSNIEDWCMMLLRLKDYAINMESRRQLAEEMSFFGPEGLLRNIMGEDLFNKLSYPNMEKDIMSSMRMVQPLIFGVK